MMPCTIGFISRGGPGTRATALSPVSIHNPGAVPFAFGSTIAPTRHHRLPPIDFRHRPAAHREPTANRRR